MTGKPQPHVTAAAQSGALRTPLVATPPVASLQRLASIMQDGQLAPRHVLARRVVDLADDVCRRQAVDVLQHRIDLRKLLEEGRKMVIAVGNVVRSCTAESHGWLLAGSSSDLPQSSP